MDGGATRHSRPPSLLQPLFSFILSLDVRSKKELAEDWIDDKDGLLVFVRGVPPTLLSISALYEGNFYFLYLYQSGLFSATIMVFIAGGNSKMLCSPIAANALIVAQMSYDLMGMLNGTYGGSTRPPPPPSPMSYRPSVSIWINIIWSFSLTFSLICAFFGWSLRRWAFRYRLHNSPRVDPRDPRVRHRRLQAINGLETFRPSAMVALLYILLPLSVFLFYFGLILFLIHTDPTPGMALISSLVIAGLLYVFLLFLRA